MATPNKDGYFGSPVGSEIIGEAGAGRKPGTELSWSAKKPKSWSELMAMANLPEVDREFAGAQGPITRDIPGYGKVIFTPQTSGSTPWSATYTRADGIKNNLSPNTQFEGGGDTDALWDYEPKDESFGKGLWEAFKYPALAATGAHFLGPLMGGTATTGAGATEALSTLGAGGGTAASDLMAFEAASATVPSWGTTAATTGAGAGSALSDLEAFETASSTVPSWSATQAAAPVVEKSFNATPWDKITNSSPSKILEAFSSSPNGVSTALNTGSALSKILSGSGGMQDLLSLLGPAMELYSGKEGLDRAEDMSNLIGGDVGNALGGTNSLGITQPSLNPINAPGITAPTFDKLSAVSAPGITAPTFGELPAINAPGITPPTFSLPTLDPITGQPVDRSAQAQAAITGADPWGASGGRNLADEQLQALMRSPGSLMSDPGYQARMMGVDRVMAAQGQLGGGGGAVAAANASGDYYDQRLQSLARLQALGDPLGAQQLGLGQEQLGLAEGELGLRGQVANSAQALDLGQLGVQQGQLNLTGQVAAAERGIQLGQLDTQRGQLGVDQARLGLLGQTAASDQAIQLGQLGVQQGQLGAEQARLNLAGQTAASDQAIQLGQLGVQQGNLGLEAQKAMADLGVSKGKLGLEGAKIKLAAAGGANTLAGESLAAIGSGVTRATGGNTMMSQIQQFLNAYRMSGATI